jgi:hypothetical protein
MSEGIKGYRNPGDIDIRRFSLISATGQIIDLSSLTIDFSVFQNLFEHYLQCDLVINDSVGLINTLNGDKDNSVAGGFTGGEILVVSYKSNDDSLEYKNHFFALYELTDRKRIEERSEAYFLSGISIEAYPAMSNKICRAYGGGGGNLISKMVESIIGEFVYTESVKSLHYNYRDTIGLRQTKEVDVDETIGLQKYIIPNLTVDDTIDFLAKEADSPDHIPYYIFYENSKGFNFKNLGNLIKQDVKEEFVYLPSNLNEGKGSANDENFDRTKIISFDVIKQSNILDNIQGGLYKSKTIHLDILRKNKREVTFDYNDYVEKFSKLQPHKIVGDVDTFPVVRMMTSRTGHDNDSIFADEAPTPKKYGEVIGQSQSYESHIFNTIVEINIPGDSELDVGDIIRLNIPVASTSNDQDGDEDKYLSGKYLITKLRHKMLDGNDSFTTILECSKDTGTKI